MNKGSSEIEDTQQATVNATVPVSDWHTVTWEVVTDRGRLGDGNEPFRVGTITLGPRCHDYYGDRSMGWCDTQTSATLNVGQYLPWAHPGVFLHSQVSSTAKWVISNHYVAVRPVASTPHAALVSGETYGAHGETGKGVQGGLIPWHSLTYKYNIPAH